MPVIPACPDVQRLRDLLLGKVSTSDAGDLEQHLSTCDRCVRTVTALEAEDTLVAAVRHARSSGVKEVDTVLNNLMGRLKEQRPSVVSSEEKTRAPNTSAIAKIDETGPVLTFQPHGSLTERVLEFLAPSRGGGEIGWLGTYRVLEILGCGGMGVVFRAEDPQLKRLVALKVMQSALMGSEQQRERFLREAQLTALIEHDHIVTIYQVGEDRDVLFLSMQLLKGENLDERVQRLGKLPVLDVLRIGRQLATGLAEAHERGLVHRDIKPGNIWLEAETDRVKILDFGLARTVEDNPAAEQGSIVGTPAYMAPEQARGETAGPAADLFSVGVVLYKLCTGETPFRGANTIAVLMAISTDQPQPLAELNPETPPALAQLVMRLLEKKPEDRPASAAELAATLAQIERQLTTPPRRWLHWIVAAVVLFGAIGTAAFILGSRATRHDPPPASAVPTEGELVLSNDDAEDLQIVLAQGDSETQRIKMGTPQTLTLAGGEYELRLAEPREGLQLSPNHVAVVPGEKQTVAVRRVGQLQLLSRLGAAIPSVAFASKENRVVAAADRFVLLLDLVKGSELGSWKGHGNTVRCVALLADGRLALSGSGDRSGKSDFTVRLWDVAKGKEVSAYPGHTSWVTGVAFNADGKRAVSGSYDQTAIVWQVAANRMVSQRRLEGHEAGINSVALSADGHYVLTGGSDNSVVLWDADRGTMIRRIEGNAEYSVRSVAIAPDGRWAASGGTDQTLRLWDLETSEELMRLEGFEGWVNSVAISPDGRRLLAGSADKTVRLFDVATGQELGRFREHTAAVQCVAFAADGRRAVSSGVDRSIRLWQLP